jgi:precorrin-6B methylase 1
MDKNTMSELLKLDFSRMETFLFNENTVSPELVHQFFNEKNFTTLKFLVLENLVHPGNLLFEVFNT